MKILKAKKVKLEPKDRDTRIRIKFAWLPKRVNNTIVIWLEFYKLEQRFYSAGWVGDHFCGSFWSDGFIKI